MSRKKPKKKAPPRGPRTQPRNSAWAQRQTLGLDGMANAGGNHLSLRDEGRLTSGHRSTAFDAGRKLRHMPISFVSAGCLEGTIKFNVAEPVKPELAPSPSALPFRPLDVNPDAMAHVTIRSPARSASVSSAASSASSEEVVLFKGRRRANTPPRPSLFGDGPAATKKTDASVREESRALPTRPATKPVTEVATKVATEVAPKVAMELVRELAAAEATTEAAAEAATEAAVEGPSAPPHTAAAMEETASSDTPQLSRLSLDEKSLPNRAHDANADDDDDTNSDTNSVNDTLFEQRRGGKPKWQGKTTEWVSRSKPGVGWLPVQDRPDMDKFLRGEVDPRQAAMDDYMQNVEAFGLAGDTPAGFSRREMDLDAGSHNDWDPDQLQEEEIDDMNGWDSDMLRDLDGMSTSSDLEEPVVRILKKRLRVAGLQYLVLYEGRTPDDGRWVPASYLKTPSDRTLVQEFEAYLLSRPQPSDSDDESDSEPAAFYEDGDDDDLDDEELDDETIARVLQKQEELGLGSDELLLHAHDEYFSTTTRVSHASSAAIDRPSKRRQKRAGGGRRSDPTYPSAAAMADALDMDPYDGFDIMDTERPSLRPKKKGRRGQLPPELEESDMFEQLQAQFAADRAKKRVKKAEREELRKQGLLGRKGKAPDLKVKYNDGIVMMEIMEDIRDFMSSETQSLSLPPMQAEGRALIHQVVQQFGINSKSRGDGTKRFTVLSKTSRTVAFSDDAFDAVIDHPKFKHRLLRNGARRERFAPGGRAAKKGPRPAVGYKDGDVVGASAPELGPENKGRALMEKMGWSKGMALGATDNKGILHPVAHIVKTNKAGLQ